MNSRFYSPLLVLYVRGFLHAFFFALSTMVIYGFIIVSEPVLYYLLKILGLSRVFLDYINLAVMPLIYALILSICVKRKDLILGFMRFLLIGWVLNVILLSVAILTSSFKDSGYLHVAGSKLYMLLLFINPIPIVAEVVIPRTAVHVEVYNTVTGSSRRVGSEASLSSEEVLRIEIYGDGDKVNFKIEPSGSIRISNLMKTHLYSYVDATPLTAVKSLLEIHCGDKLLRRVEVNVKNMTYRNITFYTYLNDDYIGSSSLSIESNKQLIDAIQPVLTASLSKIGIANTDISEIQFYTKDNIYIPSTAKIIDLPETDEFIVRIYTVDKIGEYLKYMRKSDVYELWETLVKRLEIVRNRVPSILRNLEDLKRDLDNVISNWW